MRTDLNPAPELLLESSRSGAASNLSGSSFVSHELDGEAEAYFSRAHNQEQVQALVVQASQLPEVRAERVHALRLAIQRGLYQSRPEDLAGAVLAHMVAGTATWRRPHKRVSGT